MWAITALPSGGGGLGGGRVRDVVEDASARVALDDALVALDLLEDRRAHADTAPLTPLLARLRHRHAVAAARDAIEHFENGRVQRRAGRLLLGAHAGGLG